MENYFVWFRHMHNRIPFWQNCLLNLFSFLGQVQTYHITFVLKFISSLHTVYTYYFRLQFFDLVTLIIMPWRHQDIIFFANFWARIFEIRIMHLISYNRAFLRIVFTGAFFLVPATILLGYRHWCLYTAACGMECSVLLALLSVILWPGSLLVSKYKKELY